MNKVEQIVTQNFDIWSSAVKKKSSVGIGSNSKIELYGVKKLCELILDLAVRGLLVTQEPNDEPASELLKKITSEKANLIKEGKIKKEIPLDPIGKFLKIPLSWENILVQDFAEIKLGSTTRLMESKYWNGYIPWLSSGEVANCIINDTFEKITLDGLKNSSTSIIPARSLLMAIIGQDKTRGQTAILGIDACTNQNIASFIFNEKYVISEYVWIWAKSKYDEHRGYGHGGAQPALNAKKVKSFVFRLPPIEEQKRIVAKVDELMTLCDTLKEKINLSQEIQLQLAGVFTHPC